MPALLFDLDGTLLETDAIHRAVFADMLAPHGIEVTEAYYAANLHGRLNEDFFAETLPHAGEPTALSEAKEAEFRRRLPRPYPGMPGAVDFVRRAVAEGWPRAVVTNAMRPNAEAMLEAIGLADAFELVVVGGECARGKPHPEPYRVAMAELGVAPSDSIAFEDSLTGIASAAGAGALTVAVASAGLPAARLAAAGARLVIRDFTDPALESALDILKGAPAP